MDAHVQMFAHTYMHTKSDVPYLRRPLSGLSAAHLSISNEFSAWEIEAIKREGMRKGSCAVCSLWPMKIRDVYNVRCPGHSHSPRPVSFLWRDNSHMPAHNQGTTHQQPGTQDDQVSTSLSNLCHRQSIVLAAVTLDSARLVCLCVSLFMHPVSPALWTMYRHNHALTPEYHPAQILMHEGWSTKCHFVLSEKLISKHTHVSLCVHLCLQHVLLLIRTHLF